MEPVREQILNLQHISYTYHTLQGETLALSDISFSLKKGEFAAIVGPSGCGKSTLLSLICGLLPVGFVPAGEFANLAEVFKVVRSSVFVN